MKFETNHSTEIHSSSEEKKMISCLDISASLRFVYYLFVVYKINESQDMVNHKYLLKKEKQDSWKRHCFVHSINMKLVKKCILFERKSWEKGVKNQRKVWERDERNPIFMSCRHTVSLSASLQIIWSLTSWHWQLI